MGLAYYLLAKLAAAAEQSRRRWRRSGGVEYDPGQRCQARWPTSRRSVPRQQPPPAPRRLTTPEAALWKAVEACGAAGMGRDGCGRVGRFSARCAVGGTMARALTGCVVHACRRSAQNQRDRYVTVTCIADACSRPCTLCACEGRCWSWCHPPVQWDVLRTLWWAAVAQYYCSTAYGVPGARLL